MKVSEEFFGTPDMKTVAFKASQLWNVVKDDPRFQSHGRAVGVNWDENDVEAWATGRGARITEQGWDPQAGPGLN